MTTTTATMTTTTLLPIPGNAVTRFLSDGWVTTWRNLMKIIRVPEILLFSLIQPVMFVLLFTYVFGAAITIPGDGYTWFMGAAHHAIAPARVGYDNQSLDDRSTP